MSNLKAKDTKETYLIGKLLADGNFKQNSFIKHLYINRASKFRF